MYGCFVGFCCDVQKRGKNRKEKNFGKLLTTLWCGQCDGNVKYGICHFHKKVMLRRNEMSTHVINDILTCLASVLISFEKTQGWQCERIQMVIPHVQ